MCGISAVLGGRDGLRTVRRMHTCLAHRGPDDEGVVVLHDALGLLSGAVAQRRLAIIDLSQGGHQPMVSGDGRYALAFNGEIYNYKSLRVALQNDGAKFLTGSDTEVLLNGLAIHGPEFVRRLRGMFAFVLWDSATSRALLGRDPFGMKPLWLGAQAGVLAIASEVRALVASGVVNRRLSASAVAGYLMWGAPPEPHAALEGATAVPPGSVLEVLVKDGRASQPTVVARISPFEPLPDETNPLDEHPEASVEKKILTALRESVSAHLVADVPVAVFLSGGIDSSVVAALATEMSDRALESFTVVFEEPGFSEAVHARAAATRFGTRHHEIPLSGVDFLGNLETAFSAMDQPSMDGLNTFVISRAVRQTGIKVVLSGLGGDEIFAGYPSFRRALRLKRWWSLLRMLRAPGRVVLEHAGIHGAKISAMLQEESPARAAYSASRTLFPASSIAALMDVKMAPVQDDEPELLSVLQRVSWYETTGYMRDVLLRDSDIFAMANALELRVPFVDRGVVAASLAVADSLKLQHGISKPLLVHALGDRLPREVWDRPKRGFALPFAEWMRGPLRGEVESALTSSARLNRVGIRSPAARAIWSGFLGGRRGMTWSRPWAIYTLVRWAEEVGAEVSGDSAARDTSGAPALAS